MPSAKFNAKLTKRRAKFTKINHKVIAARDARGCKISMIIEVVFRYPELIPLTLRRKQALNHWVIVKKQISNAHGNRKTKL